MYFVKKKRLFFTTMHIEVSDLNKTLEKSLPDKLKVTITVDDIRL